jgi:hypothetical protein
VPKDVWKTVSAFSNTAVGYLVARPCMGGEQGSSVSNRPPRVSRSLVTDQPAHVAASLISDQPLASLTSPPRQLVRMCTVSRTLAGLMLLACVTGQKLSQKTPNAHLPRSRPPQSLATVFRITPNQPIEKSHGQKSEKSTARTSL